MTTLSLLLAKLQRLAVSFWIDVVLRPASAVLVVICHAA